jgi:hypothetical protein
MSGEFVKLEVDGVEVPLTATQRLLQRSPFPGGHHCKLVLCDQELVRAWFSDLAPQERPGPDVQWSIFYGLDRVAG